MPVNSITPYTSSGNSSELENTDKSYNLNFITVIIASVIKQIEKNNKKNVDEDQIKILESALDYINNEKDINLLILC